MARAPLSRPHEGPAALTRFGRQDAAFWAALLVSAVVLLVPRAPTPGPDLPGLDKVVHGLVFAVLTLTACRRFGRRTTVAAALAGYAVVTELVQGLVLVDRAGDALDVSADLVGAASGWLLARHAARRSQVASAVTPPLDAPPTMR